MEAIALDKLESSTTTPMGYLAGAPSAGPRANTEIRITPAKPRRLAQT
jgi:hypothetical protein